MARSHYPRGYSFKAKKKKRARLSLLFVLLTLLLLPLSAAPLFATRYWLADQASHFAVYYLLLASCCFILLLGYKRRVFALMALAIACVQGYSIATSWDFSRVDASTPEQTVGSDQLHVMTHNINWHNQHKQELVDEILQRAGEVEIVVLQEVTPEWAPYLEKLRKTYVYNTIQPREDGFGYAVFSRVPTTSIEPAKLPDGAPVAVVRAYTQQKLVPFTLFAAHLQAPLSPAKWHARNTSLEELAKRVHAEKNPNRIVVGDFNITPFSPWFTRFYQQAGLTRPVHHLTPTGSWPGVLPALLRLPIDQALGSSGITTSRQMIGTFGSDHTAQLADYLLPAHKAISLEHALADEFVPEPMADGKAVLSGEEQGPPPLRQLPPEKRPVTPEAEANHLPDLESEMPQNGLPTVKPVATQTTDQPVDSAVAIPRKPPARAPRRVPLASEWGTLHSGTATIEYEDDLERRISGTH